jgi:histidine triad (HIT) family protein
MSSIFTKIIQGSIPSYKVAEDDNFYAFLDINPLTKGHTLVVPKKEVDYLFDLEDDVYLELMKFSKKTALAIEATFPCLRMGMVVYGLDVPHAHVHLIPLHGNNDIDFSKPKLKLSAEEFSTIAQSIFETFQNR